MKYLLSILCLFVLSCDSDDGNIHGCLDSQACNYNPNASIDNNSCIYELDCTGECGNAEYDECGVCNGLGLNEDGCCADEILLDSGLVDVWNSGGDWVLGQYQLYSCSTCENGYYSVESHSPSSEADDVMMELSCEDVNILQDIIDINPSLDGENPIGFGYITWEFDTNLETYSRLKNLDLNSLGITQLPENFCNLSDECYINVSDNNLCDEYQFDCIDNWGTQDTSNCP